MPNKRAKNKVFFGGFIDRRVKRAITRAAARAGMKDNVLAFAMDAILRQIRSKRRS